MNSQGFLFADDLVYGGKYVQASVTIAEVLPANTLAGADGRKIDKPTIRFEGKSKVFVVNKTNLRLLRLACGTTDELKWVGHKVVIAPVLLASAFGQPNVPAIRVLLPDGTPVPFGCRKHMGKPLVGTATVQQGAKEA